LCKKTSFLCDIEVVVNPMEKIQSEVCDSGLFFSDLEVYREKQNG
jgi:hypothetical protein